MDPQSITKELCSVLDAGPTADVQRSTQIPKILLELKSLDPTELEQITASLAQFTQQNAAADQPEDSNAWQITAAQVVNHLITLCQSAGIQPTKATVDNLEACYGACPPEDNFRNQILGLLATLGDVMSISAWKRLLCNDPPQHRSGIAMAFTPLMRDDRPLDQAFFDELLTKAIGHLPVAAAVLDLANYAFRNELIQPHPATSRAAQLSDLLGQLANQMARIEEGNVPDDMPATQISQSVADAVALIIPLCDAMALMNYTEAIGKLNRTLELKHRRLQTEAAAALAKLGDANGQTILVDLAAHPNVRLRVLAYAKELGIEKEISLEYQGEIAMAESQLAVWLSEAAQMGIAPSQIELLDSRELNWPSYDQPIQCFLMKYRYGDQFNNIGISGPLTHAFAADISELSLAQMYAAFAGWQTIHQEIFVVPIDRARKALPGVTANLERKIRDNQASPEFDPEHLEPTALGGFFGAYQLVLTTKQDAAKPGTLILTDSDSCWIPAGQPTAPIDWELALDIWKGAQLLANFNPEEQYQD